MVVAGEALIGNLEENERGRPILGLEKASNAIAQTCTRQSALSWAMTASNTGEIAIASTRARTGVYTRTGRTKVLLGLWKRRVVPEPKDRCDSCIHGRG